MVPDIIIRSRRVSREVCPLLTKPLLTDVDKKERCLQAQNQQSGEVAGTSSLPPKTTSETCLLTMEVFKEKRGSDLSPSLELGDQSCHRPSLQACQLLVMF